jgi:hypothetical protein
MGGERHAPADLPPGKTLYPLYRRLGRPHSRLGRVRKISPPPGFDHWAVQPLASRYTDSTIPAKIAPTYNLFIILLQNPVLGCEVSVPALWNVTLQRLCLLYSHIGARWWWRSGWGTALQTGRSRIRFPMVSLEFFIYIILPAALWPCGRFSL